MASYFTVFTEVGVDHMGRYRDRLVPVGERWLIAHRFVSADWRAPGSRSSVRIHGPDAVPESPSKTGYGRVRLR